MGRPKLDTKLEWNVYALDTNSKKIIVENIFDHGGFRADCRKYAKKYSKDREKFLEKVKISLAYYFWSKCEWEVVICGWPTSWTSIEKKIDAYEQVQLNWDVFCDYIWANAVVLRRKEKNEIQL